MQDDWNTRWEAIGPHRRREIGRAIQRGQAVYDVRDAGLAVELIDRKRVPERLARVQRWFTPKHVVLGLALAIPVQLLTHHLIVAGLILFVGLYLVGLGAYLNRLAVRTIEARAKNQQLL